MKKILFLIFTFLLTSSAADIYAQEYDVGVTAILSPPEEVVIDVAYPLKSEITNFGSEAVTFGVVYDIYISGTSTLITSDTSTVILMPGGIVDTITFNDTFTPSLDTSYQLISYTVLAEDENPANNTSTTNTSTFLDVAVWYGNVDGSPIEGNTNANWDINAFVYCGPEVFGADVHLCLGANDLYIDTLMSIDEGTILYPFTEWDVAQFLQPDGSPPNPEGWSSQSFIGFARLLPGSEAPWLHLETPTHVLTYVVHTIDNVMLKGQTVTAIGIGLNQMQGVSNAGDTIGAAGYPVLEHFSPFHFQGGGNVAGTVTDENSQPVEGVVVVDLNTSTTILTNGNGQYTLIDLYPGDHDISFSHPYHLDTIVTDVYIIPNYTVTLNVQLQPLPFDDAGVSDIISPPQFVQLNVEYPLKSQVVNYGTATSSFDVVFEAYILDDPSPLIVDTFAVSDMPGSSVDTITFSSTLLTEFDTTYSLISYTLLEDDNDASNDTATSTSSIFFGVSAWYGNLDDSPITGFVDDRFNVDVHIQTVEDIYLSYIHLCLGTNDQYIDSLLSQDEGQIYYPFTEWDIALFSPRYWAPPNPENWSSQSFWGVSSIGSETNPWLHFVTPTKALTFMVKAVNDPLLVGNTVECFGPGFNPSLGPSSASDTLVTQNYPVIEAFSPVFFKAVGFIEGIVTDQTFIPIEDVFVSALGTSIHDSTNVNGLYSLDSLNIGTYDILFSHPEFRDTTVTGVEILPRQVIVLNIELKFPCDYVPGDINGDGLVIGSDITYGTLYFSGDGPPPPDSCFNEIDDEWLYAAADCNGDCSFIMSDITYLVSFFRGLNPPPQFCPFTPPFSPPNTASRYNNLKLPMIHPHKIISMEDEK